jgi:hypothetical protein
VGSVVPAVLTLVGAVAVYIVGSKGLEAQVSVSAMVLCFAVSLLIGTLFGGQLRVEYEYAVTDPVRVQQHEFALQQIRFKVEVQRLEDYIEFLKLKRDYANEEKLDLSHFDSTFEGKALTGQEATSK